MDLTQVNHYLDLSSSSSSSVTLIIELQRVMKTKFHYPIFISSNSLNKQIWKSVNRSRWTIDMVKIYNPKLEHSSPTVESTLIHLETIISLRHAVAINLCHPETAQEQNPFATIHSSLPKITVPSTRRRSWYNIFKPLFTLPYLEATPMFTTTNTSRSFHRR